MAPVIAALPIIAKVVTVAGSVLGAVGSITSASAQNREIEANAKAAEQNAKIAQQNASQEARNRSNALAQNRRQYNLLKGEARAQSGALGIFGGSSLDILADMDSQQLFEQTAIVDQSVATQQSYYNQAAAFKNQASSMRAGKQSGTLGAISSLTKGFGSAIARIDTGPTIPSGGKWDDTIA